MTFNKYGEAAVGFEGFIEIPLPFFLPDIFCVIFRLDGASPKYQNFVNGLPTPQLPRTAFSDGFQI
jgi:hypothetical protein